MLIKRKKNIIIFGKSEPNDEEFLNDLFSYIGLKKDHLRHYRLGKKVDNKTRPIKVIFDEIDHKRRFLSFLHKLTSGSDRFKSITIQHDLSLSKFIT